MNEAEPDIAARVQSAMTEFLTTLKAEPAPPGTLCPECHRETLQVTRLPFTGPYSGTIKCTECGYKNTVMSFLGQSMVRVEPLSGQGV